MTFEEWYAEYKAGAYSRLIEPHTKRQQMRAAWNAAVEACAKVPTERTHPDMSAGYYAQEIRRLKAGE